MTCDDTKWHKMTQNYKKWHDNQNRNDMTIEIEMTCNDEKRTCNHTKWHKMTQNCKNWHELTLSTIEI